MAETDLPPEANTTVLVIDDSPENRYVLRRALSRAGMAVLEAGTGAEGTAVVERDTEVIDLIVLDVNLPDTDGFVLCRRFKADPATAHVPVVHLSQSAVDDSSQVRGLEGGADAYLTEPVHASVLVATIRSLLRMRKAEELLRQEAEEADRLAALNSRVAAANTETEIVLALLEALNSPWTVRRAHLLPSRPWLGQPDQVYPRVSAGRAGAGGPEGTGEPLAVSLDRLAEMVDAVVVKDEYRNRLWYEERGARALVVLPLIAYGREMGTLLIEFADGIALPVRNQVRLGAAAERCAQAMERARLFEEQRSIAFDLQASLLPAKLPEVPGVELAAQYRAGAKGMVVGGDWYDVFVGVDGWSAIIGDVCGRGAMAASRTSLTRHTAREAARHDDDPTTVLRALQVAIDADRRAEQLDLITAISLKIAPGPDGTDITYAIAGHPLPILIRADGEVRQVGQPGPMLGINSSARFTTSQTLLSPGDVLFLYTDGVIESRRSGVLFGESRLMELLAEMVTAGAPVQELAEAPIAAAAAYNELHDDDMATLVLRAGGA